MKYESYAVTCMRKMVKSIDKDAFKDTLVCDMSRVKTKDMHELARMFDDDELTLLLTSYVMLKMAKDKKAYLSKFVKKMIK